MTPPDDTMLPLLLALTGCAEPDPVDTGIRLSDLTEVELSIRDDELPTDRSVPYYITVPFPELGIRVWISSEGEPFEGITDDFTLEDDVVCELGTSTVQCDPRQWFYTGYYEELLLFYFDVEG